LLGERVELWQALAGVVVVGGVYLVHQSKQR
jgi:hypothetical protein